MNSSYKVTACLGSDKDGFDIVVGSFEVDAEVGGKEDWDAIAKIANEKFGADGWEILQLWETTTVMRDMITKGE